MRSDKSPKNAPREGSWDLSSPAAPPQEARPCPPVPVPRLCGVLLRVLLEEAAAGAKSPLGKAGVDGDGQRGLGAMVTLFGAVAAPR